MKFIEQTLTLLDEEREVLERYIRRGKTSQRFAQRARIVLESAKGVENRVVAKRVGVDAQGSFALEHP